MNANIRNNGSLTCVAGVRRGGKGERRASSLASVMKLYDFIEFSNFGLLSTTVIILKLSR